MALRRDRWLRTILLATGLAGGLGGAARWLSSQGAAREPVPLHVDAMRAPRTPEPRGTPELAPQDVPDLPDVPTLAPGTSLRRAARPAPSPSEPLDDLAEEMRLLREARRRVGEDPRAALALLERHRERFPQGALREEREAYAIEALVALGRHDEAERRFLEFTMDHPDSRLRGHLERAMR